MIVFVSVWVSCIVFMCKCVNNHVKVCLCVCVFLCVCVCDYEYICLIISVFYFNESLCVCLKK